MHFLCDMSVSKCYPNQNKYSYFFAGIPPSIFQNQNIFKDLRFVNMKSKISKKFFFLETSGNLNETMSKSFCQF